MDGEVAFKERLVKYNMKINITNGVFAVIAANLVTPYFAKFAERLGAGDYEIGMLSSLPAAISIFTLIPGAILIESFKNKKNITGTMIFIHKLFYLLLAAVPFVSKNYQAWLFVLLVGLMNLPGSIGVMGYQSSIGDIFDSENLGKAMSSRNIYSTAVGILITLISAQLITRIPNTNRQTIIMYQMLFVVTFILSQGEVISFLKFRGIRKAKKEKEARYIDSLKETIKSIPRERNFIIFMTSSLIFYLGWQMGWPLFNIYTISNLKADEFWLSIMAVSNSIASIASFKLWAKFAKKKGNTYALFIATIGMSLTPLMYAVSKSLIALVLFNIIIGISMAGTIQTIFNLLLEVTPNKNRTVYIAIYNTLMNISAAISPLIGVAIKDKTNIFIALIIVSLLRFLGSIAFMISSKLIVKGQLKRSNEYS